MRSKRLYLYIINFLILLVTLIIVLLKGYYDIEAFISLIVISIIIQLINIIINRKNNIIVILGIFLLLYYFPIFQKYYMGYEINPYGYTTYGLNGIKTTIIYCIFAIVYSFILIIFKFKIKSNIDIVKNIRYKNNNIIFNTIIIIIIIGIIFGHSGTIAVMGQYGKGDSSVSSLNEYVIIFFILAFIYSGKCKKKNIVIMVLAIIYSIINILYGDRIGILMLGIVIFIFRYNNKYNYKKIIIIASLIGAIFATIGIIRTHGILKNNTNDNVIETNQGNVFIASNQIIRLRDENIINKEELLKSFTEYFGRIVIPKSKVSDLGDPSVYAYTYYKESLGGGFIGAYWYLWFGIIGVVLIGIIIGVLIINIREYKSNYRIVLIIANLAFFPRWIAYEPLQIIKIPIISIVLYFFLEIMDDITSNVR